MRVDATRLLVDAARDTSGVQVAVLPTIAFVYPPGPADETSPLAAVAPHLQSALTAEQAIARFAAQRGRRGVVLRLGLLSGPGAASAAPDRRRPVVSTSDAGRALVAALRLPSGIYNVVDPGGDVSGAKFAAAVSSW